MRRNPVVVAGGPDPSRRPHGTGPRPPRGAEGSSLPGHGSRVSIRGDLGGRKESIGRRGRPHERWTPNAPREGTDQQRLGNVQVRMVGGPRGTRTHNPRIKSPLL